MSLSMPHADAALRAAAAALDPAMLVFALRAGADPAGASKLGCTALMLACMNGGDDKVTLEIVVTLLATGFGSVEHQAAVTGLTALMLAAQLGMHTVVRALIEAGASLETVGADGQSAWCKASICMRGLGLHPCGDRLHAYVATLLVLSEAGALDTHICESKPIKPTARNLVAEQWSSLHSLVHDTRPCRENASPDSTYDAVELKQGLRELSTSYALNSAQIRSFEDRRHLRIDRLLSPAVLVEARSRLIALASRATGGVDASVPLVPLTQPPAGATEADVDAWWERVSEPAVRSWHMQLMWAADPVLRDLVLSPRIGDVVCGLLGCDAVRLYHDNALSRAPGSKPTRWHCDDGPSGYMALEGLKVVTVWIPLQRTTPVHGSCVAPPDTPFSMCPAYPSAPPRQSLSPTPMHPAPLPTPKD